MEKRVKSECRNPIFQRDGKKVSVKMKSIILYEDKDLLVCIKPALFPVQSAKAGAMDMESELRNYLSAKKEPAAKLSVIHRLDQPVSGVIVFAKNAASAAKLSAAVQNGEMKKIYRALVAGRPKEEKGILTDYLIRDFSSNLSRVCSENERNLLPANRKKEAKKAILSYRCLKEGVDSFYFQEMKALDYTELEIRLQTGRHHQIRVQLSHMGTPIVGDIKYGDAAMAELSKKLNLKALCLCAYQLEFVHPTTGKKMHFCVKDAR